jgi:RNA polymerase sigma-70 factor (ECF subfamily)
MNDDGDAKLKRAFELLSRGDRSGLEIIWAEYARPLHNYAFALTGSPEDADDVIAEVMWAMMVRGRQLGSVRHPKRYLFAAARNRARSVLRRRARSGHGTGAAQEQLQMLNPAGKPTPVEDVAVRQAVMALPLEQREILVLHIWGGLTFEEAAQVVGVSPNTAASRYRYATEKLRKMLKDSI